MKTMIAMMALMMSSAAGAKPTYLDCTMDDGSGRAIPWSVSLDEDAKTMTYSHKFATVTKPAMFTPDEVLVTSRATVGTDTYRLDRTTGQFVITMELASSVEPFVRSGQCKVTTKKRAF